LSGENEFLFIFNDFGAKVKMKCGDQRSALIVPLAEITARQSRNQKHISRRAHREHGDLLNVMISQKVPPIVTPAEAGVQNILK
jgi:hypothetical protein